MNFSEEEMQAYWLPFTGNRQFKQQPRIMRSAKGVYYTDQYGKELFDGISGLWSCGAGHGREEITVAVSAQIAELDFSPGFQFGHPKAFELANKVVELTPEGLDHVFFSDSGSESVETALKIARGYWRHKGKPGKTKFIGRSKGYHGVNYGGVGVGGIGFNRKLFGQSVEADHLPHTLLPQNLFSRGLPEYGVELANQLEELIILHDASNIAAVIVEPVAGTAGVIPPPKGYLKRLREICDENEILLIFDEVLTGLGRMGAYTAAEAFGVTPDIMTLAKQITNGTMPLGATIVPAEIYATFLSNGGPDYMVEFPHGYTWSAHSPSCAAALAALDLLVKEDHCGKVNYLAPIFETALHDLKGFPYVTDIRNYGLAAGISLEHYDSEPLRRPFELALKCLEKGYYVRWGADTIQLAPPFISTPEQIQGLAKAIGESLRELG